MREKSASQIALESAWRAPYFAFAAEILRHHNPGSFTWNQADRERAEDMLQYLALNARQTLYKVNNSGAAATLAQIAVGVFAEDARIYNLGIQAWKKLMPTLIDFQGLIDEVVYRDCSHPQYTLLALSQAAEVVRHQALSTNLFGIKIGSEPKPRLLQAGEFLSHMFLTQNHPYTCTKGGVTLPGAVHQGKCYHYPTDYTNGSDDACDTMGMPGFEVLFNNYRWVTPPALPLDTEAGGSMTELQTYVTQTARPDGASKYMAGFSSLTHGDLSRP